ncbi:tetratricopeptide repeat protein [Robiginitomaculum antarcticum]|uniref:tetratricopeptide repeat protein n=1 Tax=Robiginitomaculum antarcticum TaxID=437507 RepID=UPI000370E116|nr:hypothetical protein [Robiginitomaculum antarcticum]
MKILLYCAVISLCFTPAALAQDAEPFDPYKAYSQGDIQPPEPADPAQPEPPETTQDKTAPDTPLYETPIPQPVEVAPTPLPNEKSDAPILIAPDPIAPETEPLETQTEPDIEPGSAGSEILTGDEIITPPDGEDIITGGQKVPEDQIDVPVTIVDEKDLPIDRGENLAIDKSVKPQAKPSVKISEAPVLADFPAAPFYLTAEEYLTLRGDGDTPQLMLKYDVTSKRLDGSDIQITSQAVLIMGTDFAAISHARPGEPERLRIYDFKMDRHLSVEAQATGAPQLSNHSLYAGAHRNTRLVAMMTNKGARDTIELGKGLSLPAFWMESAIGFSAKSRKGDIQITDRNGVITAVYKDQDAAQITLSTKPFPDRDMSNVQLVFAHHYWPVHPTILQRLYGAVAPIDKISYVSRGPDDPKGTEYTWTLAARDNVTKPFPLPRDAVNIVQTDTAPKLAMSLRKTLTDSPIELDELSRPFAGPKTARAAWLAAQKYLTYSGQCEKNPSGEICRDIAQMAQDDSIEADLRPLIKAAAQARNSETRAKALPVLVKAAQDKDADPAVLYLAGITRARMKTSDVPRDAAKFDAEAALTKAVNADPHNPSYLMGLAQVYAAADRFEEAWDIYDTLKIVLAQPQMKGHAINLPINRVESGLRELAPAYFLPR